MAEIDNVRDELAALRRIADALDKLDVRTRRRVLAYLVDRYDPESDEGDPR